MGKYSEIMETFDIDNLPNLDVCVLGALEFLTGKKLPPIPNLDVGVGPRRSL